MATTLLLTFWRHSLFFFLTFPKPRIYFFHGQDDFSCLIPSSVQAQHPLKCVLSKTNLAAWFD